MKKNLFLVIAAILCTMSVYARDIISRNVNDLPVAAQNIVKNSFKSKVSLIKIDKGVMGISEYEVILVDGSEITFDKSGNWKDVEMPAGKSVPDYFIPKAIKDYVSKNNKGQKIVGIEKERSSYEVQLNNGIEMKFDRAGNFLRYDN